MTGNEDRLSKLRSELLAIDLWDSNYLLMEQHSRSDELAYQARQLRREKVLQEVQRIPDSSTCKFLERIPVKRIRLLFPMILFRIMARRPRPPEEVLSRKDLTELQQRLSMMSGTAVGDFYRSAYFVCRIGPGHFPSARAIQELVQAWKQMRKWR